jgi:hypothetical protein
MLLRNLNCIGGIAVFSFRANLVTFVSVALLVPSAFAATIHSSTTASTHRSRKLVTRRSHRLHGQQSIDPGRAAQIQQALIKAHYMTGEASGTWDAATIAAMQKYQADNGWQTRLMPDSRALVKLGLGPDYSTAINAKNSTFSDPPPVSTIPASQTAGFTAASGVNQ